MKHTRILSILLVLLLLCCMPVLPAAATESEELPENGMTSGSPADSGLQLQCGNAILMDVTFGQVLYEQAAYDQAYPASMTKVMTALLTLEAIQNGETTEDTMVTVSENASLKEFANESTANLVAGEQISVKDLLYCIMLPSANDAAKALAEHLGGTVDAFVERMNARAEELGCKNTHFLNPNGLHDPNHYSCAYDIALMFRQAMQHNLFLTIISTKDYTMGATNLSDARYFYNTNGLISNLYYSGYVYEKCMGGKTGSTEDAGKCLVAAARSGNNQLISVVMGAGLITQEDGSELQGQLVESRRLFEYGFENFRPVKLAPPETTVATVAVTMSEDGTEVGVKPQGTIAMMLPYSTAQDEIQMEIKLDAETVQAPVEEGQVMGSLRLYAGEETLGELDLIAEQTLTYSKTMERQLKRQAFWAKYKGWFIGVPLCIILLPIAALITIRIINVRKMKRRRQRAAQRRAAQQRRQRQQ